MRLHGKTVLVTGAGGFIGSHLCERLTNEGASVRALMRYTSSSNRGWLECSTVANEIEFYYGDLRDASSLRRAVKSVDIVFHLGALIAIPYSYDAPESYVQTNVIGTLNILQAALEAGVDRVVHTSTSEVYGSAQFVPIDEAHPLVGQSPYSASKIAADKMAEAFHRSFALPVVTVRPFNTFGPRQSARAVIPTIVTQALLRDTLLLGDLRPTRDLTYISDTVEGFLRAATCDRAIGLTINLGQGAEISIGALAELICEIIGRKPAIKTDPERLRPSKSEVERLLSDTKCAQELLKWTPSIPLRTGLEQTIGWIKENLNMYKIGEYVK